MTIRITGDGPKITATGSGSTVLVEISTGQHDPGSFSGVHNDLSGRSTAGAHVGTAVSIDPTGFAGNLDGTIVNAQLLAAAVDDLAGGGGGGAVDSVDGRTGVVTLDDLYQTVGVEIATVDTTLAGPPRTVITAIVDGTVTLPTAGVGDVGQHWHISTGPYELTVVGCDGGDVTVPVGMVLSVVGFEGPGPVYGWAQLGFKTIDAPTSGGADLSDATPQALGTAAAGTGTAAARDDHVHAMPTASSITVDASGFNGNLTTSDDTVQEIAQKFDDLSIPAAGIADPGGSNDDFLQRKSGAWTYRTPAQVKTDLGVSSPVTSIVPVAVGDYLHLPRGLGSTYAAFSPKPTATNSNGHVRYVPFFVDRGITFDELALHVVDGNAGASAVLRLGIFADNAGRPGTVVADAGTASLNSTGVKSLALSPAVALTHGWYWFAVATQGLDTAGTNPTYSALQNTTTLSGGTAVQASNQPYPFLSSSGITGAFANNPTVSMNYTGQPTTYNVYGKVSALA